tara:strand:+ start:369 stop:605 length:237 start_codon:yes stop_codon:yes gene_type:complete
MTDEQINKLADKVAKLIINNLHEGLILDMKDETEEELLSELAALMTQLDFNLQLEAYTKCEEIKRKIIKIENQLNKYK